MKALKLPGRLADKLTEGSIKDQESMVRDPRRARRLDISPEESDALKRAADLLYPADDPRSTEWPSAQELGWLRTRLRELAGE